MAFSSKFLVASITVMGLVAACADACTSTGDNVGLFTDNVPWGCTEPFDCFVEFCSCVDGTLSTTCTPFNATTSAATIEMCAARRVTCTLNVALNARSVYNSSCQQWGEGLTKEYATFYADRSNTNLTDACMADMCGVVTAGAPNLADSVNYTYVCSLVNFSFPVPVPKGEVSGCVPSARTYFSDTLPLKHCSEVSACYATYCTCLGGTYNATKLRTCTMPATQPSSATSVSCLGTALECFVTAAIDSYYVPGASPLSLDPCLAWSVPIAEDYAAYYNSQSTASQQQSTGLWQTCNATACEELYRFNTSVAFAGACDFTASAVPTFQPFDPCPYTCPDDTCAISLEGCACTNNAVVSDIQSEFLNPISSSMTFDVTKALTVSASAAYGISSGNCSSYDFTPALKFSWWLTDPNGTLVKALNASTFSIDASTLTVDYTYTLNLSATGLKRTQVAMKSWTFTVVAPTPKVSITGAGATMRIPNTRSVAVKAVVTDVTSGTYSWSCVSVSGTCPVLTNATSSVLYIASGEAAGTYLITYTYRGMYNSTLNLTIIAGEIPYVRILVPSTGALNTNPVAFLNSQTILLGSLVTFSSAVTYEWTVNADTTVKSNTSTFTILASMLTTSTLSEIMAENYNENTINLKVTSNASSTVYGEASIVVVVVESLSVTLSIAKQGGGTTAEGLNDKLIFTPSSSVTTTNSPFGASIQYSIVYYDNVSNRDTAVGVDTAVSGSTRVGTAPLFTDSGSSKSVIFSVVLRLNDLTAASGNSTFTITKPTDLTAVANREIAALASITDPAAAVSAASKMRALMKLSTNATEVKAMAAASLKLMNDTLRSGTPLSADQQVAVFGTIGTALATQDESTKKALSKEMASVMETTLSSSSFDSDNTDAVLGVIESMDSENGGSTTVLLARALSNDPKQPIGEPKTVSIGGFSVTAVRQVGGALAGLEVSSSGGAGMSIPSTFSFAGIGEDDVVGVASTVLTTNPFGSDTPTGSVVTFDMTSNGAALTVTGLSSELEIKLASSGICQYYDESTSAWSSVGLRTVLVSSTETLCYTTHLTAFGSFASSAATLAISAVVVVLAALVQLVLA